MGNTIKIGVIRTSHVENERRVPIYPDHLLWIDHSLRAKLVFEENYGHDYGYSDDYFLHNGAKIANRKDLFEICNLLILAKPVKSDLEQMKAHQILFGWQHCVQQKLITQSAIDKRLTLIAWESMHDWSAAGERMMHIFYKNNELAGYAAVLHVMQLLGIDGLYGPRRKVAVMGYGAVSRGAISALQGRGFNNIFVYSKRPMHLIANQNPDVYFRHMIIDKGGPIKVQNYDGTESPLIEELSDADIICNGVLQDTENPMIFLDNNQLCKLKPRSIIIDISCDEGMGFSFAKPTTFENPIFKVGNDISYYSVDHTPSYLWNAASREISRALIPYLPEIAEGPYAWERNETIKRAIEIKDGVILNKKILSFQKRDESYPHNFK